MKDKQRKPQVAESADRRPESATAFPKPHDEAVQADSLKRREPKPKKPGERLEDYLG